MNFNESPLWYLIIKFPFDATHPVETFPQRLARTGNWSPEYTLEVIEEYKRFLYLCATSKVVVAPPSAVDMAWTIHMDFYQEKFQALYEFIPQHKLHRKQFFVRKYSNQFWLTGTDWFFKHYRLSEKHYLRIFGEWPPSNIWLREEKELHENRTTTVNLGNLLIFDIDVRFICIFLFVTGLFLSFGFSDPTPAVLGIIAAIVCYFKHPAMNRDYDQANDGKGYRDAIKQSQ